MPSLYEAASRNFREVEKALTQLERAINRSVRDSDEAAVEALTQGQALLVAVKAEARLTKVITMPSGLTASDRETALAEGTALDRWKAVVNLSFRRHYRVAHKRALEDRLDHDVLAKRTTLHDLIDHDLEAVIRMRNKLAHGQWLYPLNSGLSAVEPGTLRLFADENSLSLKYRDNLVTQLGNCVVALVKSEKDFEAKFDFYFERIRSNRQELDRHDYHAWCEELRSKRVRLSPDDG